ncbi:MAG: hypothetical protein AAB074_03125 [Planctomycetota bacterium]
MRHIVFAACLLFAALDTSAQDPGFREVSSQEPFMGAPLGVGIARGGIGFSWGTGRAVSLFDLKSGDAKGEFAEHGSEVTAGAGCPGARLVATGDSSGAVRIWDPSTRKERIKIEARPSPVRSIGWSPTGAFLAVVTEDRVLTVWRVENGSRILDDPLPATGASDVLFSPEGDRLVLVRRDREERDGEIASGLQLNEYEIAGEVRTRKKRWERRDADPAADPYAGARADARARRVALMDGDEVLVWALDDEREVCRVSGGADAVAWRRDGKLLVARGRELALASAQSGRVEKRWPGVEGTTWLVASDDNRVAVGGGPRGGSLWKLASGDGQPEDIGGAADAITGKGIIVVRDASGRGTAIRAEDGAMSGADGDAPDPSTGLPGICASFEDDTVLFVSEGRPVAHTIASASDVSCGEPKAAPVLGVLCAGESVAAWGAASWTLRDAGGKELMKGAGRPVKARGRWLVVRAGHGLNVIDANAGRQVIDFPACDAFDLANDSIAVLDDGEAVVFNLARDREPFRMSAARATDIALSPDGRTVAFDNGALALWDVTSQRKTLSTDLRGPLAALQFHPGGAMVAALTGNGEFRLFNEDGISALKTTEAALPGESGAPFAFSPDGTRMALAWSDGVRFYDLEQGLKASILRGAAGAPEFAPRGERWSLRNGAAFEVYEGADHVESMSPDAADFTPAGALAVADRAGVRIWDGKWRGTVTTESAAGVSVSADGKRIAVAAGTKLLVFEK